MSLYIRIAITIIMCGLIAMAIAEWVDIRLATISVDNTKVIVLDPLPFPED